MAEEEVVRAADWPAAREAGYLLATLGFTVRSGADDGSALHSGHRRVTKPPTTRDEDLADSGLLDLTGHPDAAPRPPTGRPATVARGAGLAFELLTGVRVDGAALLGERAPHIGARRAGRCSTGGGTRLLRARDGWWALNLSRDADLVPALVEREEVDDVWRAVERWSRDRAAECVVHRAALLGLPCAVLGETAAPLMPWRRRRAPSSGSRAADPPLVVNFGALWAGPLAARLLAAAGARVVHVESTSRPDPSALATPAFYASLREGGTVQRMDFADRDALRRLASEADVVIEASRPRAFRRLGIDASDVLRPGRRRVWLRITGHTDPDRVAFGDDAAVAGGLVGYDDAGDPVFAGDAIADPLTGLLGALAAVAAWRGQDPQLIHLTLAGTAAFCARDDTPGARLTRRPPRRPAA